MLGREGTCWPVRRSSTVEQAEGKGRREGRKASEGAVTAVKPQARSSMGKALSPDLRPPALAWLTSCNHSAVG